jgi:hypothetical protein
LLEIHLEFRWWWLRRRGDNYSFENVIAIFILLLKVNVYNGFYFISSAYILKVFNLVRVLVVILK